MMKRLIRNIPFRKYYRCFSTRITTDSFMNGVSSLYIEQMYKLWKDDKTSVHSSWDQYFTNLQNGVDFTQAYQGPPNLVGSFSGINFSPSTNIKTQQDKVSMEDTLKVLLLIRSFQTNGYLKANLDPLNMDISQKNDQLIRIYQNLTTLDYKSYGFTEEDLDREFMIYTDKLTGILSEKQPVKLRNIIERLNKAYCSTIGIEYMYISGREECNFLRDRFENMWINYSVPKEEKFHLHTRLSWAVLFEEFLQTKFTTHKRFGLEGLDSLIVGLKSFVDYSVTQGVGDITLGMAHRGRLNVLANVFKKPLSKIFAEFQGKWGETDEDWEHSGDVKYHLGTHYERVYQNGMKVKLDIPPNPSHLEAVNPVVQGQTRAKQHFNKDSRREKHIAILIHGDASFAGQGVVYESTQMQNLDDYEVGGILHVIANNQIGFTTSPKEGRSTPFCCDLAKAYQAPIIHVNADDPEAMEFAFKVAAEYRIKFKKDVILDVIGYRRHGHNELDQPFFTQPLMYNIISKHKNVLALYEEKLNKEGIDQELLDQQKKKIRDFMEKSYIDASNNIFNTKDWIPKQWENLNVTHLYSAPQQTGLKLPLLREIGEKISTLPNNFNFHPQIKKIYENRLNSIITGKGIDWATAEALAWSTLIKEGYVVRISGQDVERGTFSHRHSVLHDQLENKRFIPIHSICNDISEFQSCNSHLSEFAVLGFEFGFSIYNPDGLIIWEAQFGDFANGAQIIIDQFISNSESKWNVANGLVLLLPHGMDGQGAEHSSCRLERFLQLCDDDPREIPDFNEDKVWQIQKTNMQVCNPSFSANYFHLLRRQLKRNFRKPLIVSSPKKLLRFAQAGSNIEEFDEGLGFTKVRGERLDVIKKNAKNVKRVLVCSGQVYYDLLAERQKKKADNVAIVAVEQIAPFPYKDFYDSIKEFSNAEIVWTQEEHMNAGCWTYVEPRINNLLKTLNFKNNRVSYAGRDPSAAAATGHHHTHDKELHSFLNQAFNKV